MKDATNTPLTFPAVSDQPMVDPLTQVLRDGARKLLAQAVEAEVQQWIQDHTHLVDADGHRQVVRNGHAQPRSVVTGLGPIEVSMPRVHDKRPEDQRERFASKILPPYLRKAKSVGELLPWLYLKGVSTGGMTEALQALLGPDCPGLSAATVSRLNQQWQEEHGQWETRDLSNKRYVYVWADGIYFNVRLGEDNKQCVLVLIGATEDGRKELIAIQDGYRESEQSWTQMLLGLKQRGLTIAPELAIADGALGFWAACRKTWSNTQEQRCWVHKTANVLNKLPKRLQPKAKDDLHQIWMAPDRKSAHEAFDMKRLNCLSTATKPSTPRPRSA